MTGHLRHMLKKRTLFLTSSAPINLLPTASVNDNSMGQPIFPACYCTSIGMLNPPANSIEYSACSKVSTQLPHLPLWWCIHLDGIKQPKSNRNDWKMGMFQCKLYSPFPSNLHSRERNGIHTCKTACAPNDALWVTAAVRGPNRHFWHECQECTKSQCLSSLSRKTT